MLSTATTSIYAADLSQLPVSTQITLGATIGTTLSLIEQTTLYEYAYRGAKTICESSIATCQAAGSAFWSTCKAFGKKCGSLLGY